MTSRHGVHAARQTAFRLPEGLLAWLKEQAGREGDKVTMTAIAERALERERERCEGINTSAGPAGAWRERGSVERLYPEGQRGPPLYPPPRGGPAGRAPSLRQPLRSSSPSR